jgi:hypothetical protein
MAFEFLLGISETLLCSKPGLQVEIVLLDALQLPMLFIRILTYFEQKLLLSIIFYNYAF